MSEDESFVILGSTPTPSMDRYGSISLNGGAPRSTTVPENAPMTSGRNFLLQNGSFSANGPPATLSQSTMSEPGQAFSMISMAAALDVNNVPAADGKATGSMTSSGAMASNGCDNADVDSTSNQVVGQFLLGETSGYASSASVNPLNGMMNSGISSRPGGSFKVESGSVVLNELVDSVADESVKASLVHYFPSMCTPQASDEDMQKLGHLVCDHLELKANLKKTDIMWRQHFANIKQFQESIKIYKQKKAQDEAVYKDEISKLKDEIIALNKELIDKSEHFEMSQKVTQQDNLELVQELSHSKSIIINMTEQIIKLEQGHHSFEMVNGASLKASPPSMASRRSVTPPTSDSASTISKLEKTISEHVATIANLNQKVLVSAGDREQIIEMRSVIHNKTINAEKQQSRINEIAQELAKAKEDTKNLQKAHCALQQRDHIITGLEMSLNDTTYELSSVMAENLEIMDMKSVYIDQMECLTANQKSMETELKRVNSEIKDLNNKYAIADMENKDLKSEVELLQQQVDVYKNDFELERTARQDLASEREEIISDLKLLQRRNEELFNATQKNCPGSSQSPTSTTTATAPGMETTGGNSTRGKAYICPVCNLKFDDYARLEHHVDACIK